MWLRPCSKVILVLLEYVIELGDGSLYTMLLHAPARRRTPQGVKKENKLGSRTAHGKFMMKRKEKHQNEDKAPGRGTAGRQSRKRCYQIMLHTKMAVVMMMLARGTHG